MSAEPTTDPAQTLVRDGQITVLHTLLTEIQGAT
jgi:hypothetical protein